MAKPRVKQQKVGVDSVRRSKTTPILLVVAGVILLALIAALIQAKPWESSSSSDDNGTELREFQILEDCNGEPAIGRRIRDPLDAPDPWIDGLVFIPLVETQYAAYLQVSRRAPKQFPIGPYALDR